MTVASAGIVLASALAATGGKLVYTFDDAYIHLAVAENVARGHYGVNWGEPSAPCSSVLWPFLLAPFCWLGLEEPAPLAINLISTLATTAAVSKTVAPLLQNFRPVARRLLMTGLVGLVLAATNVVPLVFSGLEHSLQLALVASIVAGVTVFAHTGNLPGWTAAALVAAPLVRYENLGVSLAALGVVAASGQTRKALALGAAMMLLLGSYSTFLTVQGLAALPSSVLLKSHLLRAEHAPLVWLHGLTHSLGTAQGLRLAAVAACFAVAARVHRASRPARLLALFGSGVAVTQLVAGQLDWYGRYGAYAWLASLLVLLALWGSQLQEWLRVRPLLVSVALSSALVVFERRELNNIWEVPLASRNVYEQQYQMHRFVTENYRAPVAVNDIGWVSYRNDTYVLDLWGLASPAVQAARSSGKAQWMEMLVRSKGVKLAMLYEHWFDKLPGSWHPLATLHLGRRPVTAAGDTVTFYATDPKAAPGLTEALMEFRRTLPQGVRLRLRQ